RPAESRARILPGCYILRGCLLDEFELLIAHVLCAHGGRVACCAVLRWRGDGEGKKGSSLRTRTQYKRTPTEEPVVTSTVARKQRLATNLRRSRQACEERSAWRRMN